MKKFLTFVVPIFNTDNHLLIKCVDSLLNQIPCEELYEIILVNNGSNAENRRIINNYYEKNKEVIKVIVFNENVGFSAACNKGISNARGSYIHFVDSDDLVSNTLLRDLRNVIGKSDDVDIVFVNSWVINKESNVVIDSFAYNWEAILSSSIIQNKEAYKRYEFSNDELSQEKFIFGPGQVWNKIFSSKFLSINNLKFNEKLKRVSPDVLFSLESTMKMVKYSLISKPGYFYRENVGHGIVNSLTLSDCNFYDEGLIFLDEFWYKFKTQSNLNSTTKNNFGLFLLMYSLYLLNLVHYSNKKKLYKLFASFFKKEDVKSFFDNIQLQPKWKLLLINLRANNFLLFYTSLLIYKIIKKLRFI